MCIPGAGGAGFPEDRMVRMVEIHQEELGICLAKLNLFQGLFQMLRFQESRPNPCVSLCIDLCSLM